MVQLGDFFYLSGQIGKGSTFHDQCVSACYAVTDVLHQFDLRFDHILKFTVYLVDIELRDKFLEVFSNIRRSALPGADLRRIASSSRRCPWSASTAAA